MASILSNGFSDAVLRTNNIQILENARLILTILYFMLFTDNLSRSASKNCVTEYVD